MPRSAVTRVGATAGAEAGMRASARTSIADSYDGARPPSLTIFFFVLAEFALAGYMGEAA